jgi:hypothetical protein
MVLTAEEQRRKFMPHRSHYGWADSALGISMFWAEKVVLFLMYCQRLALLLLWDLKWPTLFYRRMTFMFGFLIDLTAHHENVDALGAGTIFEGCETICKLVWPVVCISLLAMWAGVALLDNTPLYYTRNIERVLWTVVRLGLLPFMNTLLRYFILNEDGNLTHKHQEYITPISETGIFLALVTFCTFIAVAYVRSAKQVLFKSTIRHDAFLRARELEYVLRFSCMYRNDRLWMIASYNFEAWWWSLLRGLVDMALLVNMVFTPVEYGAFVGTALLFLQGGYALLFADVHRCWSSNVLEHVSNVTLFVFCIFGILQVYEVRNALLVDTNLDYFLFGLHGFAALLFILFSLYFFVDGHVLGVMRTAAEKRAKRKWKMTFVGADGDIQLADEAPLVDVDDDEDAAAMEREAFVQEMHKASVAAENAQANERFYVPKQREFMDIDTSSPHVWPVNAVIINELLRRNTNDHLIDVLRAARKMLDRISALHNTPVLIPTDELKTHINRLQTCLVVCKRQRITHHANAIHPLQTTFEDLIEQFTYELRVFSGRSVTVGHNARKMIEVSRYLRSRMVKRDRTLALISPMMRRILMKLFALRIFIELVEERPEYLMPKADKPFGSENESLEGSDSDDGEVHVVRKPAKAKGDVFGDNNDDDALREFERGDDEGLGDDESDEDAENEARLAELLKEQREKKDQ